jgi:methyltransferase-like protein/SAM-dependent methyltransferase
MSVTRPNSYDEVPYESHPFPQTHPDRLATVATLFGMRPAPVDRCRVLELGCAGGGNLIPMAVALPESRFFGVDLSGRQIADGQKTVDALGLTNIELKRLSILDVTPDFGQFDYIICHGVYSWVPPPVQDKILDICARNLTADGVAYVSYNTYPGWHMRGMIRDMMCYHAGQLTDPHVRVRQARDLLDFLARSVARGNDPYGLLLQSEVEVIRRSRDSYLLHDHLEEVNDPVYFHQFAERVAAKGLRYLGEADLRVMVPGNYPPEVEGVLHTLSPDLIHLEQYMDFLRNRQFRQTLLCHGHLTPNYVLRPEQLTAFHVASAARPVSANPDLHSAAFEEFRSPGGTTLNSRQPVMKAAMAHLAEVWPQAVPFPSLLAVARSRLHPGAPPDPATLARDVHLLGEGLLQCYTSASSGLVELSTGPPCFAPAVSERPVASPLARLQAAAGATVTNLRHETVVLSECNRQVLRHLDGSRDRDALLDVLAGLAAQGVLVVQQDGRPLRDAERVRAILGAALGQGLPELARAALLAA